MTSSIFSVRLRALLLVGACVGVLGLTGCGGDDSTTTTPTASEATTSEAATGPTGPEGADGAVTLEDVQQELSDDGASETQANCVLEYLSDAELSDEEEQAIADSIVNEIEIDQDLVSVVDEAQAECNK